MKTEGKSMYKNEMATKYGMSLNTFSGWLKKISGLKELGYHTNLKLLTPRMVNHIDKHLGGDENKFNQEQ